MTMENVYCCCTSCVSLTTLKITKMAEAANMAIKATVPESLSSGCNFLPSGSGELVSFACLTSTESKEFIHLVAVC